MRFNGFSVNWHTTVVALALCPGGVFSGESIDTVYVCNRCHMLDLIAVQPQNLKIRPKKAGDSTTSRCVIACSLCVMVKLNL